ncbi:hypothetical protein ES703_98000 [subsurface metagenome]
MVGQRQGGQSLNQLPEIVLRFAGETHHDIGTDGRVGDGRRNTLYHRPVVGNAVPAAHGLQHTVGGVLEGHVEVGGNVLPPGHQPDKIIGDEVRLDGADPDAPQPLNPAQRRQQVVEEQALALGGPTGSPGQVIGLPRADIHPCEDDFLKALGSQAAGFFQAIVQRAAAAQPTRCGNDAVAAVVVTPLLDLQESPGAACPASRRAGSGDEGRLVVGLYFSNIPHPHQGLVLSLSKGPVLSLSKGMARPGPIHLVQ